MNKRIPPAPAGMARDEWIALETASLLEAFGDADFDEALCRRLAALELDIDVDTDDGGLSPEERFNAEILMHEGLDNAWARQVAQALTRVDLGKLLIGSRIAAQALGTNRNTIRTNMVEDRLPARIVHVAEGRQEVIAFSTGRVLFTREWQRRYPRTGGPVSGFPPRAPYNASRRRVVRTGVLDRGTLAEMDRAGAAPASPREDGTGA
ncbi:MAG: hypothetical protein IT341_07150 [Chloroflexi bacterium]|nr:hypothetical protein [Chloroflexota bacterium]